MCIKANDKCFHSIPCQKLLERLKLPDLGIEAHACNSSNWGTEAGGLRIQGQFVWRRRGKGRERDREKREEREGTGSGIGF